MGNTLVMAAVPEEAQPERLFADVLGKGATWKPPVEPWREHGTDWHKDKKLLKAHTEAVRKSLEDFLNGKLAELDFMLRTGWFVLGKTRVRVVECEPVSESRMRAHFKGIFGKGLKESRPKRKKRGKK
jgi:hypothetical protein